MVAKAKSSAAKSTPKAKPTLQAVPAADPSPSGVVAAAAPVAEVPRKTLKLKALIEAVAEQTQVRKKDSKAVVEATLAALGEALARGDDLILPPLGRARVGRSKDQGTGEMLVLKLKRGGEKKPKKVMPEALAEDGEGM